MNKKGMLVVLSAPSGCGKDTVFKEIRKIRSDVIESISATTRQPRNGEIEGINYYFKSVDSFENMIKSNQLFEYTTYNNNYYGTPVDGVEKAINEGKICFLIIDVKGAQNIMKMRPDAVTIFLLPPSMEVLEQRLNERNTDDLDEIQNRVEIAKKEIEFASIYKYQVVNDALEDAVDEINKIINKELKVHNQ